jgi:hypothetical protein
MTLDTVLTAPFLPPVDEALAILGLERENTFRLDGERWCVVRNATGEHGIFRASTIVREALFTCSRN